MAFTDRPDLQIWLNFPAIQKTALATAKGGKHEIFKVWGDQNDLHGATALRADWAKGPRQEMTILTGDSGTFHNQAPWQSSR